MWGLFISRDKSLGQVRIIGGTHRSRILKFKDGANGLRPTPDRVRETVFNWLGQNLTGKTCLDLFAGSGAIGFEAVSRNAKSVMMIELDKVVYTDLINNAQLLKAENVLIKNQNALNYIQQSLQYFDIIFIDPPYKSDLLQKCLKLLQDSTLINENTLIYIEYQQEPYLIGYEIIKKGMAGMVNFALLKVNKG
jgi:16S rRNA (guanine966-N2)-methyltransferase